MNYILISLLSLTLSIKASITQLDAYWAEVSRAVTTGDFIAYKATCHPDAVLVSGTKKASYPLSKALKKWKKEFDDTKAGNRTSNAQFRFSTRLHDETTAHESGMLLYEFTTKDGKKGTEYVFLDALLIKKNGKWLILMEYQKSLGTKKDWEKLKPSLKNNKAEVIK